jgi:uncharacterized protein YndB with AHSA1/START domain
MPSSTAVVTIDRPADVVWTAIADYGDPSWRGGIETCSLDGDVRTVTTSGRDLVLEETELHHDDEGRTFTYSVTAVRGDTLVELGDGTTLDLRTMAGHHRATMTVVPVDDTSARVVYDLTIDDDHDETFESTTRQYRAVLDRLKRQLES